MKLKYLVAAAAIAFPMSAAHADDTAQFQLDLTADVPQTCFIADTPTGGGYATFAAGGSGPAAAVNGNTLTFPAALVNPVTAGAAWPDYFGSNFDTAPGTTITFTAVCNFAGAQVDMSTQNAGLRLQNPPSTVVGGFSDAISYAARLRWNGDGVGTMKTGPSNPGNGGGSLVTTPGGSIAPTTVADPTNAVMNLRIRPRKAHEFGTGDPVNGDRDAFPLLAGTYTDTLTIRFGANP
ncbi:MAG: hypothetical protein WBN07_14880 [Woeseiaceae bacterium]